MPYHDLKYHETNEVDGPDDVDIPDHVHHMTAKAELNRLEDAGCISAEQVTDLYQSWLGS